jgi:putative flippase GtrA
VGDRFRRWGVFNLVGVGGFVTQVGTIAVLTRIAGCPPILATALALELAAFQNFCGHSRWTWPDRRPHSWREWGARYWRYQLAKTASLGGNLALTVVFVSVGLPAEIANTAAVLICALPNFLIADHYVFNGL